MWFRLIVVALALASTGACATESLDTTNYVLGTQTIGVKYGFTSDTRLVETAERIHAMGSNILKMSMGKQYCTSNYVLPRRDDIRSLTDLARKEPSFIRVLDMPFAFYHIWAYGFSTGQWADGLSDTERQSEYEELHALASYLLKRYRDSGKTFLIGHWEGDWHLRRGYDIKNDPGPVVIQGMIDWLNVRQQAIDDAKRQARVTGVHVYHYTEANLVQIGMKGRPCLVNDVLPHTRVDYVSYSSYDTINPHKGNVRDALHRALDFIEAKLPTKPGITGKRVFIGEYGFPQERGTTPELQAVYSRDLCRSAVEWGCPFVLYWEMYCNEIKDGQHRGFWLVNDKNVKQPFYHRLEDFYRRSKTYVAEHRQKHGRTPTDAEFRAHAMSLLNKD